MADADKPRVTRQRDDAWMPVGGQWARDALARAVAAAGERDLLFGDARGLPLRVTSIGGPLTRLCALAGVERQTPHGLRHQTASALLSRGVGIWGVQQVLRHKQQSLTSHLYGHLAPDVSVEFVDVLDDLTGAQRSPGFGRDGRYRLAARRLPLHQDFSDDLSRVPLPRRSFTLPSLRSDYGPTLTQPRSANRREGVEL